MESIDEGVSLADVTVINDIETQSATVVGTENGLTESKIMEGVVIQSTPIQSKKSSDEHVIMSNTIVESTPVVTKTKEKEWSMASMIELMRAMSNDIKHNMNVKLESSFNEQNVKFNEVSSNINEVRSNINEVNKRFDNSDEKFNELKININAINVKCESNFKKLGDKINEMEENFNRRADETINNTKKRTNEISIEKMEGKIDTGKCSENENNKVTDNNINNDGVSISGNYNEEMMTNNNQVKIDKVSNDVNYNDDYDSEIMVNNNKNEVVENGVSKSDMVANSGDDESVNLVEVIEGVVVSVSGGWYCF